jgi:hypothetical protein
MQNFSCIATELEFIFLVPIRSTVIKRPVKIKQEYKIPPEYVAVLFLSAHAFSHLFMPSQLRIKVIDWFYFSSIKYYKKTKACVASRGR